METQKLNRELVKPTFVDKLPPLPRVIFQAVGDWWGAWHTMILLTVLLILCWLTIVLGPPSLFAVYYVTNQLTRGENWGFGEFKTGVRLYFWKSWRWMLLNIVVVGLLSFNLFASANFSYGYIWQTVYGLGLVWWLATQFYTIPYVMQMKDERLVSNLRNGFVTTGAAPLYTLVILAFAVLVLSLSVILILPLFFGWPAMIASLGNRAVRERLETWKKKFANKAPPEDTP